ncbi:MAG: hypothetical protein LLG20_13855 [Acidobacteriales bacterium]|nr:hypothetical protein [Terriglobales bacterium]
MTRLPISLLSLILAFPLSAQVAKEAPQALDGPARQWVEETLGKLAVEEKVGQIITAGAEADFTNAGGERFRLLREEITRYHVGSYYFGAMGEAAGAALLLRRMQETARLPLLFAFDMEGGAGFTLRGATRFPMPMAIGATADPRNAYLVARLTAVEARALGINVNYSPVSDVNNNPRNPIISIRSFGEDPKQVAAIVAAYVRGCQQEGVLATAKHFPGHGDTSQDSHIELPLVSATREHLEAVELPPFQAAIDAGVAMVMTAHLDVPALGLEEKGLPATLSARVLSGLLRGKMGFQGLIVTDSMTMGGITQRYSEGDAAVRAFLAGADMILDPPSFRRYPKQPEKPAFHALVRAVQSGAISQERLDASVRRLLEAKARLGLHRSRQSAARLDEVVGAPEHQAAAQRIMEQAVTLVRDARHVLPLRPKPGERVLLLTVKDDQEAGDERGRAFVQEFVARHANTRHVEVLAGLTPREAGLILELARQADQVTAAAYIRIFAYKGSVDLSPAQIPLLKDLSHIQRPFAFVLLGSPYLLQSVPELPSYVVTYDDYPGAELAAVKALFGEIPFWGKLPISLPGLYPAGHRM